jgi:ribosomal protein S18 acetylase RimI-like enzyme
MNPSDKQNEFRIRPAQTADLGALVGIEQRCFAGDRITRRQWRYLLTKAHADTLVAEAAGGLIGYVLLLYNRATSVARLYSIAVDRAARGQGLGRVLAEAAEGAARDEGRAYMRLEIRRDNAPSLALFEGMGYRRFGVLDDYYEDHMQAIRLQKSLKTGLRPDLTHMPFYEQTLEFTCGASALMMAMKALQPEMALDRTLELRLWREATTIFMTSGHGGCGPFGLALAAFYRGFAVAIHVNDPGVPLVNSVRSAEKKEVMRLVHEEMLGEIRQAGIPVHYENLPLERVERNVAEGAIPIVLISSYRIYGEKVPHWVVVSGFDRRFVYVNDPFVDREKGESPTDSINIAIPRREFTRMARYGRAGLQAVVLLSRKDS